MMLGDLLALPPRRGRSGHAPASRLCLNQTAYELHELLPRERPAPDDLVLRHLRTAAEIDSIRFLRGHIDLTHSAGDPRFESDEKKETK